MRLNRIAMCAAAMVLCVSCIHQEPVQKTGYTDVLKEGFSDPPLSARPRVWWHWMNGNITKEGIASDIEWMKRIGIGGLQNFDASLSTPQIVENRLVYMTPEWKDAFRHAAALADSKGLELAIASSPGWSNTGGPWVQPQDGIKKISWSETAIADGEAFSGQLAEPPSATGYFQTMAEEGALGLEREGSAAPQIYRDIAVFAVPALTESAPPQPPVIKDLSGRTLDGEMLSDGRYADAVDLGPGTPEAPAGLLITYSQPVTIRSATLFMKEAHPVFETPFFSPVLEARTENRWNQIARIDISAIPTTVAFRPVRATEFRIVFRPYDGPARPAQMAPAPGAIAPAWVAPSVGPYSAKVAEFSLSGEMVTDRFEVKAGFGLVNDYHALKTSAPDDEAGIDPASVIELTHLLQPDGSLDWAPPAGSWRIIRMGWSLTGKTNHPASPEATGLEVDKMDGDAVERYLRHYLDMYRTAAGNELIGERGVRALLVDSTEVGPFNWTPRMIEHFEALRGYDPTPWLPALTGLVIGSRADTDRFLYDYRRTIADLHAREYYATIARVAHEYGLIVYGEALEDQRPVFGDDMEMRQFADIPMSAIWTWNDEYGPRPTLLGDMKGASSVAHLYGRPVVAAEAMTSALSAWSDSPSSLRRVIDLAFVHGVNRAVIHTSVHQALDDKQPGLSLMIFGQFFTRHESWAEMARPWIDYISRSSFLLQQGVNIADVAYFHGEEAPITALTAFGPAPGIPARYAYDFVNARALSDIIEVQDGQLTTPSGASYRILFLGKGSDRMTLPMLRRLKQLAEAGATIAGEPPTSSPSLTDDPSEFQQLVGKLWSGDIITQIGKGAVIATADVEQALAMIGVAPALETDDPHTADRIRFVHRMTEEGSLFYLVNLTKEPYAANFRFRVTGKVPEIWRADTAEIEPVSFRQVGGSTNVPLTIGPEDSYFVIFRESTDDLERQVTPPRPERISEIDGPWTVRFIEGRGAPPSMRLDELKSLSDMQEPGIRFYSGEMVYTTRFLRPDSIAPGAPVWIDLGQVGDLAEVTLNGEFAGHSWQSPHRIEVGSLMTQGENQLEVRVANVWVNRLIGDAQPDAEDRHSFVTVPTYAPDAPLRPAGLIGPVRILSVPGPD